MEGKSKDPRELSPEEKRHQHIQQIKRIMSWSGWILAFGALFLGSHILNKFHNELVELRQENTVLKEQIISYENAKNLPLQKR